MIKILYALFLMSVVNAVDVDTTLEWVNSKYHDKGAHWMVFASIIIFICCFQGAGLLCELWYKRTLGKFLKEQEINDANQM